jgi:hypothetical protein
MWQNVTVLKAGSLVKLILSMQCPRCEDSLPLCWTGSPAAAAPSFPTSAWCPKCCVSVPLYPPAKSLDQWLHLASLEIERVRREDACKYVYKMSRSHNKGRKAVRQWTDYDRQRIYGNILSHPGPL